MAQHKLYAVFYNENGKALWGMHRNGRTARRIAKAKHGELRAMPLPTSETWDAPTFRVSSDMIADYRDAR